jgi:hypothetical protein
VTILMNYFVSRMSDSSRIIDFGDTSYDPLVPVERALSLIVMSPPADLNGGLSLDVNRWQAWWDHRVESRPVTPSIQVIFSSSRLQCLLRKIEWGFPDAILDLETLGGKQVIPTLKELSQMGVAMPRTAEFKSIKGRAQSALAKLGDSEELHEIERELNFMGFADAVQKLQYIGGESAVTVLVTALADPEFLSDKGIPKSNMKKYSKDRDRLIISALITMVVVDRGSVRAAKQWKKWWARNKNTAQFVTPPATSYE